MVSLLSLTCLPSQLVMGLRFGLQTPLHKLPALYHCGLSAHVCLPHKCQHKLPDKLQKTRRLRGTFISSFVPKPFLGTGGGRVGLRQVGAKASTYEVRL